MNISKLIMRCRAITPLQMNGAKGTPQIRSASFRGVIRYWLRAALGGIYQDNINDLKQAESKYFGSTESGSPLRLYVNPARGKPITEQISYKDKAPLFYGGRNTTFKYYDIDKAMRLTLDTHPLRPVDDIFNPSLYAGLMLAFRFSGFGKRARRGSGALVVDKIESDGFEIPDEFKHLLTTTPADVDEMITILNGILQYTHNLRNQHNSQREFGAVASYPAVTPQHSYLYIGTQGESDYLQAIDRLWTISGPYHQRGKWAWGYARGGRRASAVHMRVWQDTHEMYYPQILFLYGGGEHEGWDQMDAVRTDFDHARDFERVYP